VQTRSTNKRSTVGHRILRPGRRKANAKRRFGFGALLKSEGLIAVVAVLAISFLACFGVAVLTWFTYRERYGVGFIEYLRLFL